ncbi:hypothetical protein KU306_14410 [Haloferax larsenii]|uniref:Uncharacterized protein n=1 Tax=Haloferax larsenii TaxID=302484 RepID=A0ABY5RCL5_HALLR|nr:hypothetical protein [Haloferax larsenii]UVE50082.1 hypothetical protein KU306_14410 [Haloferax larsenii]
MNPSNPTDRKQFLSHATDAQINRYARLELYNRGTHNLKWTVDESAKRDNDDYLFCDALTSQMGLLDWQRKAVWRLFKRMDMRWFKKFDAKRGDGEGGIPRQYKQYLVAFCIGALLFNENLPERCDKWSYYPTKENYPCKSKRYWCPHARYRAQKMGDEGDSHRVIERVAEQMGFSDEQVESCYQMVLSRLREHLQGDGD